MNSIRVSVKFVFYEKHLLLYLHSQNLPYEIQENPVKAKWRGPYGRQAIWH